MAITLVDHALTDLDTLKTFLGISGTSEDELLKLLINANTDIIENYCRRRFKKTTYTDKLYDGPGAINLFLDDYPIISVTSAKYTHPDPNVDDTDIDMTDHVIYEDKGYIYNPWVWNRGRENVKLTYVAGIDFDVDGIPNDLQMAVHQLIAMSRNTRDKAGITQEKIGNYSVSYAKKSPQESLALMAQMPGEVKTLLEPWRRPVVL